MVRPDDRVAAGVAAAVAGRMRIVPLLVRVGRVVLARVGGIGVRAVAQDHVHQDDPYGWISTHLREMVEPDRRVDHRVWTSLGHLV